MWSANEDQSILIVVRDPGTGFDPGEIPNPCAAKASIPITAAESS